MTRRIFILLPVLVLFSFAGLIVLAARAPRTWAAHWSAPTVVSAAGGEYDYGAVRNRTGDWDLLWVNSASQQLVFTQHAGSEAARSIRVDRGDVMQPDLISTPVGEFGVWVRNENGRTVLMSARLGPGNRARVSTVLSSAAPLEHPYLVRGTRGDPTIVFSWQHYGNFDLFLTRLGPGGTPSTPRVLTNAAYYSFYPRAVADERGTLHLLHLESCCGQKIWYVVYDRFNMHGIHLGRSRRLATLGSLPNGAPAQWPVDMAMDTAGNVWGAYAGDSGAYLFEADSAGRLRLRPTQVDAEFGRPNSLTLAIGRAVAYLAWEQPYDLGTYIDALRIGLHDASLSSTERVAYVSGSQLQPHTFVAGDTGTVVWESRSHGTGAVFESSDYRTAIEPSLAQRLGLGLGNPWGSVGLLLLGGFGFAVLTTTVNLLWVLGLTALGVVTLRVFRWLPTRWWVCSCVLACALFLVFVAPGAPILFLDTLPSSGLPVAPFGFMAFAAVLAFVTFVSTVPLRRVDEAYRVGLTAYAGMYFFAFLEAVIFIQQRLGYV